TMLHKFLGLGRLRRPDTRARAASRGQTKSSSRRRLPLLLERLEDRTVPTIIASGIPNWVEQGPGPITNVGAGATNTVVPHPTNADILYAGTVNGGVWKTYNATSANPTWTPLTDQYSSLAIVDLALDPRDSSNNTLWAASGRWSSLNADNSPLIGLLKTTNGGATWTPLAQSSLGGRNLTRVVPTTLTTPGQVVLV